MPSGAAGVFRIIENRDTEFFPVNLAGIIAPIGGLTPNLFFGGLAFGIFYHSGRSGNSDVGLAFDLDNFIFLKLGRDADAEAAVLAIAEFRLADGGQVGWEFDDAKYRAIVKNHQAGLLDYRGVFGVHPIERRGDAAFIFAAL